MEYMDNAMQNLMSSEMARNAEPRMTNNEIVGAINPFTWTKTAGFKNWVAPKEGETPFISTWDWYHETANASHAKDRVANELGLKVEMLKLAIEDVLAIPSIPDIGTVTGIEDAINHGRNLALAEVNQAITNRIGVE